MVIAPFLVTSTNPVSIPNQRPAPVPAPIPASFRPSHSHTYTYPHHHGYAHTSTYNPTLSHNLVSNIIPGPSRNPSSSPSQRLGPSPGPIEIPSPKHSSNFSPGAGPSSSHSQQLSPSHNIAVGSTEEQDKAQDSAQRTRPIRVPALGYCLSILPALATAQPPQPGPNHNLCRLAPQPSLYLQLLYNPRPQPQSFPVQNQPPTAATVSVQVPSSAPAPNRSQIIVPAGSYPSTS